MEDWEKELRQRRKFESLIINRPEVLHDIRRKAELSITTIGWAVWIFLCRPALLALLWFMGFRFFFKHMIDLSGLAGLDELKVYYISVIIFIILLVRGWNMYNKVRYGKQRRRASAKHVTDEKLESCFALPGKSAKKLQNMTNLTIDFLEDHHIRIKDKDSDTQINGHFRPT